MNGKGFTLVELMVAMFIGMLIMAAIYASINIAQRSSAGVTRKVAMQQDARTVLDIMAMEVRMASYNPRNSFETWGGSIAANACGGLGMTVANKGIQEAGASRLAIAMDLDGSGRIGDKDNEYIVYQYDGSNTITRSVNCGAAEQFLGGNLDATTRVKNTAAGLSLFQYFDKSGIETVTPRDIRRIRINIAADTKDKDSLTGRTKRMIYTTDVLVKNHVFSQ